MLLNALTPNSRRRRCANARLRRAATAIEFAMVAPAFMIVVVVCIEFSRMCILRNLSQNACYEAARFVISEGATVADGVGRAEEILNRVGPVDAQITINGVDGSTDENGEVVGELAFDTQFVTATVVINLRDNSLILPGTIYGDNAIRSQMTLQTERYRGFFDATDID